MGDGDEEDEGTDEWRPCFADAKLQAGHSYAITAARTVSLLPGAGASGLGLGLGVDQPLDVNLLRIRNPWGPYAWKGEWAEDSELWTADLREQLAPPDGASFWVTMDEFAAHFTGLTVCYTCPGWRDVRVQGLFKGGLSSWVAEACVIKPTPSLFTVSQTDPPSAQAQAHEYIHIGFYVLQPVLGFATEGTYTVVAFTGLHASRDVTVDLTLLPASRPNCPYLVIPATTSTHLHAFVLTARTKNTCNLSFRQTSPELLFKSRILATRQFAERKVIDASAGCSLAYAAFGRCFTVLADNAGTRTWELRVDFSASTGVTTDQADGKMETSVVVPPGTQRYVTTLVGVLKKWRVKWECHWRYSSGDGGGEDHALRINTSRLPFVKCLMQVDGVETEWVPDSDERS